MKGHFFNRVAQIKYVYSILGVLFVIILMLLPLMNSGFFGDDAANSFIKGTLQYTNHSVSQAILGEYKYWLSMGRLFIIAPLYGYSLFALVNNLTLYKSLIILSVIINIILFGYFIRIITKSTPLSLLSMLIMPMFFQFRNFHDPIMSFAMIQQNLFSFIMLSLISLLIYIKNNKNIYLIFSLGMYLLSMLTYEVALPFFLLHFLIIYAYSPNSRIILKLRLFLPFFLLSLTCILIPILIRIYLGIPIIGSGEYNTFSSGYVPSNNIMAFLITFAKQTIAAFPLSYQIPKFLSVPPYSFNDTIRLINRESAIIAIIYLLSCLIILKEVLRDSVEKKISTLDMQHLLIMGLLILILPSILVALSPRYQKEVYWSVGYLPVYISYFGVAIITICIISFIFNKMSQFNKRIGLGLLILIAIIISITGALTYANNEVVIETLNHGWLYPRLIIEDAQKDGLFKIVPNGSILLVDSRNPWWEQPGFYLMHSGVRLGYVGSNGAHSGDYVSDNLPRTAFIGNSSSRSSYHFSEMDNVFYLRYEANARNDGYAVLGRIRDLRASRRTLYNVTGTSALIYIEYANVPDRKVVLYGKSVNYDASGSYEPFWFNEGEMKTISFGKSWKMFSIAGENKTIDLKSLQLLSNLSR
jgi:hypothetical protein